MRRSIAVGLAAALFAIALPWTAGSARAALAAPTGLSPSGAASATEPLLAWQAVSGATTYRVQITLVDTFVDPAYDISTSQTVATPTEALAPGIYHWRVAARSGTTQGPWAASTFTRTATALTTPTLTGPADGAILERTTTAPVISWSSVPGAARYGLRWSWSSDFADPFDGEVRTTSAALPFLDPGETVYWQVRAVARDGVTTSAWSTVRSVGVSWVGGITGLAPADGAVRRDMVVSWAPLAGVATYQIQAMVGTDPDWTAETVLVASIPTTSYTIDNLLAEGAETWSWRVRAMDPQGRPGPWSAARTITRSLSSAAILLSPANGATVGGVVHLAWTPVVRASHYRVEVSSDPTFASVLNIHSTTQASFDLTTREEQDPFLLERGETYYWRVMGEDRAQSGQAERRPAGPWSAVRSFVYQPAITQLLTPADGATVDVPTLTWQPSDARFHRITIEDKDGTVVDQAITWANSYTSRVRLDASDGPFTWYLERVALNGEVEADRTVAWRTEERTFGIKPMVTGPTITMLVPLDLHAIETPRLRWTPVTGAAYYHVVQVWPDGSPPPGYSFFTEGRPLVYPDFTPPERGLDGWRIYEIWAFDVDDQVIAKGPSAAFTLDPLGQPSVVAPVDCVGAACPRFADTPRLSWTAVPGATTYAVSVDAYYSNGAATTELDLQPPYDSGADTEAGDYPTRWTVYACVVDRCGPGASARYSRIPPAPTLLTPTPGATVVGPQVTLTWEDLIDSPKLPGTIGPVDTEPEFYQVDLWNGVDGASTGVDGTSLTTRLSPGLWHWRVRGQTTAVAPSSALEGQFTVTWPGPIETAPADGSVVATAPTLRWQATPYTAAYDVEIHAGPTVDGPLVEARSVEQIGYVPWEELPAGTYTWRVRASSLGPVSSWSEGRTFVISGTTAPTVTTPDDHAVDLDGNVLFGWSPVSGAIAYRVEASRSPSFASIDWSQVTGQPAWASSTPLAEGTWYWRVATLGPSSAARASSSARQLTVDRSAPTLSVVGWRPLADSTLTAGRLPGRLGWAATDAGSGVARIELGQRIDTGAWTTVSTTLGGSTFDLALAPGHTYAFRLRAIDGVGRASAWVAGSPFRVSAYGEASSAVRYSGSWTVVTSSAYWGSAAKAASRAGSKAVFTTTGRSVSLVSRLGPGRGKAEIWVGSTKVATIDLLSTGYESRRVVWTRTWTTSATRTITIKVVGTAGRPRVDIDGFLTTD